MSKIISSFKVIKTFKNWPVYFGDFLGLISKKELLYKLRNGIRFFTRANSNDCGALFEIWLHEFYVPEGFKIKKNDIIVDIGAHIGFFSVFASYHAKEGKIFSFEPVPENFELFEKNVKLNEIKNIAIIKKAVSGKDGIKSLFISKDTGAHSFFQETGGETRKTKIEVETISLDTFIEKYNVKKINFLKIDCEGGEYEILYKCSSNTLNLIEKISMEYHTIDDKKNVEYLKKFLEISGFTVSIRSDKCHMLYAHR